jgi:hypothetical protein
VSVPDRVVRSFLVPKRNKRNQSKNLKRSQRKKKKRNKRTEMKNVKQKCENNLFGSERKIAMPILQFVSFQAKSSTKNAVRNLTEIEAK